jgi:ubiquinone/menaquinone biosynthesis C-methylase UbiE
MVRLRTPTDPALDHACMKLATELQPDQQPGPWDDHVAVYEQAFEPLSAAFARRALDCLELRPGERLIDVGAGTGATALMAAARGADVLAIDFAPAMAARIAARANDAAMADRVHASVMDGIALGLPDSSFDAAISVFGVILFPDAPEGMREIARVVKPGGRVAVVTWTETERYELAARLLAAIATVRGPQAPPAALPAQLRFREEQVFRSLLGSAGLDIKAVVRMQEQWRLPSARWIADHIAFAPGMAAMIDMLGADRCAVLDRFVAALERDQGRGEIALSAIAHLGVGINPATGSEKSVMVGNKTVARREMC